MGVSFRSFLESKNIEFLKQQLTSGEITSRECKEILKRLMLRGYERKKSGFSGMNTLNRQSDFQLSDQCNHARGFNYKMGNGIPHVEA